MQIETMDEAERLGKAVELSRLIIKFTLANRVEPNALLIGIDAAKALFEKPGRKFDIKTIKQEIGLRIILLSGYEMHEMWVARVMDEKTPEDETVIP